ncbi:MAG: cupin [Gammaproteobacteria bacterium]|nr:cupin [Gammaproteobacteria bacterium]NBT43972.1 cupin [Gammaproteobacteria bacterium]NBY22915.1 cupin [Gammaproteobacteria bacterium]NDE34201.1 cupin [Gammaproteobacteria bacterium]NDE56178.1 cupin [Gammaproteobacteria bacterium]
MSLLSITTDSNPKAPEWVRDPLEIAEKLSHIGVLFERWEARQPLSDHASEEEVITAYQQAIDHLKDLYGFQSVDVVSLKPDHPDREALRAKFLNEHTHDEFEVRFFVEGRGLFALHHEDRVFLVLCEKGDLLSVPDGVRHWFDMGIEPDFKCIRLFTNPEGWVANFTGDPIADRFPRLAEFLEAGS